MWAQPLIHSKPNNNVIPHFLCSSNGVWTEYPKASEKNSLGIWSDCFISLLRRYFSGTIINVVLSEYLVKRLIRDPELAVYAFRVFVIVSVYISNEVFCFLQCSQRILVKLITNRWAGNWCLIGQQGAWALQAQQESIQDSSRSGNFPN